GPPSIDHHEDERDDPHHEGPPRARHVASAVSLGASTLRTHAPCRGSCPRALTSVTEGEREIFLCACFDVLEFCRGWQKAEQLFSPCSSVEGWQKTEQ